jgi:hypothetical protein
VVSVTPLSLYPLGKNPQYLPERKEIKHPTGKKKERGKQIQETLLNVIIMRFT